MPLRVHVLLATFDGSAYRGGPEALRTPRLQPLRITVFLPLHLVRRWTIVELPVDVRPEKQRVDAYPLISY